MKFTPAQADRFFAAWFALLRYVNDVRRIVPRTPSANAPFTATLYGTRRQTVGALKRFVAFMMETERTHPGAAEEALEGLRVYGGR